MRTERITAGIIVLVAACNTAAKPKHYQQVRTALVAKAARCTTCHSDAAGAALNLYGQQLVAIGENLPMAERIERLESLPVPEATPDQPPPPVPEKSDADQDGVLNWVEILAGTSPADANDKPEPERAAHIFTVVSCHICHQQTDIPGKRGLEANPHNELGSMLFATFVVANGEPRPRSLEDRQLAAARTPILTRFARIKRRKPKGSEASYWERLRLLHVPADAADEVPSDVLEAFKQQAKAQKRKSTRDATLGIECQAHPLDGFLVDLDGLD